MICKFERTFVYYFFAFGTELSALFSVFFIIFLCYQHFKSNHEYTSIYWSLISLGYTVTAIHCLTAFLRDLFYCYSEVFNLILGTVEWYFFFFLSFWNFILGLYRCTALGFSVKHEQIWANKKLLAIISNLLFPFLVNGYNFMGKNCITYGLTDICKAELNSYLIIAFIINSVFSAIILAFVIFVVCKAKNNNNAAASNMTYRSKVERRFIIQTILSTILQTLFYFFYSFRIICPECDKAMFVGISLFFYIMHHYSNMIVFLVVSPIFRQNIFNFYRIPIGKEWNTGNTITIKVSTISKVSSH